MPSIARCYSPLFLQNHLPEGRHLFPGVVAVQLAQTYRWHQSKNLESSVDDYCLADASALRAFRTIISHKG